MSTDPLDAARQLIRMGYRQGARRRLHEIVRADPQNALAWELLATLLEDPAEQAQCYRRILEIDPEHAHASARLQALASASAGSASPEPPSRKVEAAPEVETIIIETRSDHAPAEDPKPSLPETDEIRKLLRHEGLHAPEEEITRKLDSGEATDSSSERVQALARGRVENTGCLAWLLGLVGVHPSNPTLHVWREQKPMGRESQSRASPRGQLRPEDILKLAGDPIPPQDRRQCPKCQAAISRHDARCPWCGTSLSDITDQDGG